jgi:HEPN domain-containing protein
MTGKRKAEATRWLQQAIHDLRAARWNIEGGFHDTASFLAQQAAEKALKSLLYYIGARRTALLTHSLVEMIGVAGRRVGAVGDLLAEGRELDLHYVPSRYPNGLPSGYPHAFYARETAERAAAAADRILTAVTDHFRAAGDPDIVNPTEESPAS